MNHQKTPAARGRKPAPSEQILARQKRQADGYRTSRQRNALEIAEDYVELIDDLIRERGEARTVDMAALLGVSHVTVTKTIRRLQKEGLVEAQPYRSIFLTPHGSDLASRCRRRHRDVTQFLVAIGVMAQTAELDAEGIEHHVSEETLTAMRRYIKNGSPRRPKK